MTVLCGGDGMLVRKLGEEKVRVIPIKKMRRDVYVGEEIESFFKILKILRGEKPDVFHINSSKMGGLGGLAGRLTGVKKIIFTTHGWAFNEDRNWLSKLIIMKLVWCTIQLSHKTICVSEKTKRDVSWMPFIKNKLVVIRNGISRFNLVERKDQTFTVGTIAELHKIKGLDILLTAWSKFVRNHQAKLVIIGDGEERQNLQNMAQKLGISGSVVFKGFVDNARSFLSSFDIFCMPSRSEAMPYALLEAGFAGLPVIATSVGGIPEIIEPSINGALIEPEDPEVLFSTMVLFAQDEDLRRRLGKNLRETILKDFSSDKMVEKTFDLYL